MLSKTEVSKLVSRVALAVSVGAGGVYWTGEANANPKATQWTIVVSCWQRSSSLTVKQ